MKAIVDGAKQAQRKKTPKSVLTDSSKPTSKETARTFIDLQQQIGNQAVQRLIGSQAGTRMKVDRFGRGDDDQAPERITSVPNSIQTRTVIESFPFQAQIRRGPGMVERGQTTKTTSRSDAPIGEENEENKLESTFEKITGKAGKEGPQAASETPAETTQAGAGGAGQAATPEGEGAPPAAASTGGTAETGTPASEGASAAGAGQPISMPDIEIPVLEQIEKTDAVVPLYLHSGSITRGGAQPTGFGVTRSFGSRLTNIVITSFPGLFMIRGTLEHPITYQIRTSLGPNNQVDIASENDPDITATNYPTVADDLTPNMSDLNGRPPRRQFWAEDLTTRHELVHANDDKNNGPLAMLTTWAWLQSQTASSERQVYQLLGQVPSRFASALLAALSTEDGEKHAYGDGAPSYLARANAIRAKGGRGEYT